MKTFLPSNDPRKEIARVTYSGQDPKRRQYQSGYETYMANMPLLHPDDALFEAKLAYSKAVMDSLGEALSVARWPRENMPLPGGFDRSILGIQDSVQLEDTKKEGAEIVVARWGTGFTSPVHGHAAGYMYDNIVRGKMKVTTYRITDHEAMTVRPVRMDIVEKGPFASQFNPASTTAIRRPYLVHSFTALEPSVSLHFLPEHTRDGRDNRFNVEHFEDVYRIGRSMVERITSNQGMRLKVGEVVLVRSSNVPEYGDHFIVVTGGPVIKAHGMRVQEVTMPATNKASALIDQYDKNHFTLLKLNDALRDAFLDFHGIEMVNGKVVFPNT